MEPVISCHCEDTPMERKDVDALPREDRHTEPPTSRRESAKEGTHAKLDTTSDYLRSIIIISIIRRAEPQMSCLLTGRRGWSYAGFFFFFSRIAAP